MNQDLPPDMSPEPAMIEDSSTTASASSRKRAYHSIGLINISSPTIGSAVSGLDMMPIDRKTTRIRKPETATVSSDADIRKHNEEIEKRRMEKQLSKQRRRVLNNT